jgi:hypothetical protein
MLVQFVVNASRLEPAWDCRFSSCCHVYHTWCAYSHFSKDLKCLFEGCSKEPHTDWWDMVGIPKPHEVPTMPQEESWNICKSENAGVGYHGKIHAFTRVFFSLQLLSFGLQVFWTRFWEA